MKLLTFSTLFPNPEKQSHGIFVQTRLRYLLGSGQVESRVVAPVPWFPSTDPRFGDYAHYSKVPAQENRFGIEVTHPRYLTIPKIGMNVAPFLLAAAAKRHIGRIIDEGYDFDAIDAHYFYPDGVAAIMLGRHFNKPVVITARGTDINLIPRHIVPRKLILWAASQAQGMITVCNALKDEMVALGVDGARITPLRNGVDLQLFQPGDRAALRARLGLEDFTLMSVGHLIERKGHEIPVAALASLPHVRLLIAGDGPQRRNLEELARQAGVLDRVTFLGALPQAALTEYYGAVDALVLASSREGWANVLLESMACGTPVIASNVWGTPEVVAAPEAGVLMRERTAKGLVEAVAALRANYPTHEATRRYAERFSWADTTQGQIDLFRKIIG
ncbi:MAG: glycosyltransferase family 4 protein [Herminiimonas sp.]|nr:glycosyltransferase family 4 protein [Herminiimonas sp.]